MFSGWIRNRRRRRLIAQPFPIDWEQHLRRHSRHFALLAPEQQDRVREIVRVMLAEKDWAGAGGPKR